MAIEDELRAALVARAEDLLQAAVWCIGEARDTLADGGGWSRIAEARHAMDRAEALHAGILNRCGLSWDVMASRQDQTRQALHRRLGKRADELIREAVIYEELHLRQIGEHMADLMGAVDRRALEALAEPEDYFRQASEELTEARRHPRWWEWWSWWRAQLG
jgi:hypothetical protein